MHTLMVILFTRGNFMKVFYGDRNLRIHSTNIFRNIKERGYMFYDEDSGCRITARDVSHLIKPTQSPIYLKGIVDGSRGMRGYDIRVLRELLAFCKEKGYDEVVEYIEYKIERM